MGKTLLMLELVFHVPAKIPGDIPDDSKKTPSGKSFRTSL
jgi:hypothetical protein